MLYDSLGETYLELEDHDLALKNYEQTLKLDPQNKNAGEMIKKIRLKH
ncbi:tetratricopeptide repeat protein [Chryseobacterium sp. 18068]|nr:tetratricopeptide repeat protein [Chryseobacterium sp. 18068]